MNAKITIASLALVLLLAGGGLTNVANAQGEGDGPMGIDMFALSAELHDEVMEILGDETTTRAEKHDLIMDLMVVFEADLEDIRAEYECERTAAQNVLEGELREEREAKRDEIPVR